MRTLPKYLACEAAFIRAADPHCLNADPGMGPGPAFSNRGSGLPDLNPGSGPRIRIPDPDLGPEYPVWKIIFSWKFNFFCI